MTLSSSFNSTSVLVLGHTGFLGSHVLRKLQDRKVHSNGVSRSSGFDLRDSNSLDDLLESGEFKVLINCAAVVGGIEFGRQNPVSIFRDNVKITLNVLEAASRHGLKVISPISNCAYPRELRVFREDEFWDGPLDESVLVYGAVRKLGWVGSWAYSQESRIDSVNLVFPNLYGPGDHLDPVRAHALGALVNRILRAKFENKPTIKIWGTGSPIREWMYVEDAAEAIISAITKPLPVEILNIGTGQGISIRNLAHLIAKKVGYKGVIDFDSSKMDGAPQKIMDGSRGNSLLDWTPKMNLELGIERTIDWYRDALKI